MLVRWLANAGLALFLLGVKGWNMCSPIEIISTLVKHRQGKSDGVDLGWAEFFSFIFFLSFTNTMWI